MFRSCSCVILFLITLSLFVVADDITPLSERDFLRLIGPRIDESSTMQKARIDLEIDRVELDGSRADYANWQLLFEAEFGLDVEDNDRVTTSTSAYSGRDSDRDRGVSLIASKRSLNHPGSLEVGISRELPSSNIDNYRNGVFDTSYQTYDYESRLVVDWKIPLLKQGEDASLFKTFKRNILDFEREQLTLAEERMDMIFDALDFFINWSYNQQLNATYLEGVAMLNRFSLRGGKPSAAVRRMIDKYERGAQSAGTRELRYRTHLYRFVDGKTLEAGAQIDEVLILRFVENSRRYLERHSYSLQKSLIDQRLKEININYYKNRQLPQLDMELEVERQLADTQTQTTNYSENTTSYELSFNFEKSLFPDPGEAKNLRIEELRLRRLQIEHAEELEELIAEAEDLERELRVLKTNFEQARLSLLQAKEDLSLFAEASPSSQGIEEAAFIEAVEALVEAKTLYLKSWYDYREGLLFYDEVFNRAPLSLEGA